MKDSDEEKSLVSQILLPDLSLILEKNGRGGGTAIIHRELMKILVHGGNFEATTMECSSYNIKLADETLCLYVIYQIPSTGVLQLCGKLTLLEQDITYMHERVLLVGDFNIHIDKKVSPDTITFSDRLEGLNLGTNIEMEMHTSCHTLNLIISCKDSLVIVTNRVHQISDHCIIHSTLHIKKPKPD